MEIVANRDVCIEAGLCALTAPAVFDQDDGAVVTLLVEDVPPEQVDKAREAVHHCPSGALSVLDGRHRPGQSTPQGLSLAVLSGHVGDWPTS